MKFCRARKPAEIEARKKQLLDAAEKMLKEERDVSLSALAREAGMSKSNVYRYFESREAVLLSILITQWDLWAQDLLEGIPQTAPGHTALAALLARTHAARPILCQLTSILPSTLEHNVSPGSIVEFKTAAAAIIFDISQDLFSARPELPIEAYRELFRMAVTLLIGLWPMANPSPVVQEVLAAEELAMFRHDFESDLARSLEIILLGLERKWVASVG